jgi:chromosome segregation ATPase
MTSDEAIILLLEKFTNLEARQEKLEARQEKFEARQEKFEVKLDQVITEVKELRRDIKKVEAKVDAEVKELRRDINRIETKIDTVQSTQNNMRSGIKNLRRIVDEFHTETSQGFARLESEFKAHRRYVQSSVNDIHLRQDHTEDQVEAIKDKLDKAIELKINNSTDEALNSL